MLVLLIGPLIGLSAFVIKEAAAGVKFIQETVRGEGMTGLIERLPGPLDRYANEALARLGDLGQIEPQLSAQGGKAASAVGTALVATGSLLFQGAMMLIALFFLLVGGDALLSWVDSVSPLRRGQTRELLAEFRKVSAAVIVSTLITAGVQAAAAHRVPDCRDAASDLLRCGHVFRRHDSGDRRRQRVPVRRAGPAGNRPPVHGPVPGDLGVAIVGLVDNVVKPYLIKGDVEMEGVVVFFSVIGGIAAFGMAGLLIGPLAVALFLALLRIYSATSWPLSKDGARPMR